VLLGWKIDNPARPKQCLLLGYKHLASPDLSALAGLRIGTEIFRECVFECQSKSFAHDALSINRIHKGFYVRFQ